MKRPLRLFQTTLAAIFFAGVCLIQGCKPTEGPASSAELADREVNVVATTSMIADLVREIGGERVDVTGLMGPGIDPHLYKASAGDVTRMGEADVIFYSGLHLEGKMTDLFEQIAGRGIRTVAVAEHIEKAKLIESTGFGGNYDPHVWFDVSLWMVAARSVEAVLSDMDSAHASIYQTNLDRYLGELQELDAYVKQRAAEVPGEQRVLVTSHDAFGYFGRAYGFDVRGLQGISTAAEAGTADVQALAAFVAERKLPALFVESSVSPRGIEAVIEAVRARGHEVRIGGNLYSDALGDPGTPEGTYTGMVRHNVDAIVNALTGDLPV